ncbi:DUF11 domain-containing protein, partial [Patescibacteria group bacterium]|nr:DUF11 domain-containing protein [Patescibacteria group bacterium]
GSQNDSCGISYCGDGTQDQGEECDDGNNQDGDGCSGLCVEEALGIISGFKFWDMDGSLETTTDRQGLIDWVINLLQDDQVVNTATTDQSGYYEFSDLEPGAYNLEEELLPDWSQLFFPSNIINIVYDSIFDNQNFINTEEAEEPFCGDESCNGEETCSSCPEDCGECEVEPYCGDGSCNNEETCSTCPEDCGQCEQPGPYCGDGSCNGSETCSSCSADCGSCGGGGGGTIPLRIHNEKVESRTGNTIIVSWFTNHSATSRVVYDTVSHPVLGEAPNYGYANSTEEDPTKVTYHTVTITGLVPNTAYYLMPISHGSPEVHGIELESTEGGEGVIVLGEAGAPSLSVSKTVNKTAVDAGEQNIEYTVSITNSGNLTAFDVAMADTLPANFSFSDGGGTGKSWTIGDLEPGQTHEESYLVNLASNISDGIYANIVQVSASNHDTVTASVDLEVEAGETLVGSGIKMIEYILLIITALFLMSIAQVLKRKEYNI